MNRKDAITEPETAWPKCAVCGWWDRRLRSVGLNVSPQERLIIHRWAKHGDPLPSDWAKDLHGVRGLQKPDPDPS